MTGMSLLTRGFISPIQQIINTIPILPEDAQNLLVKSLELPLPLSMTEALGIFQSDIAIRSAIIMAIADLRANPWLLDYVFASLPKDELTMKAYGEKEVAAAKKWFSNTNIPVFLNVRQDDSSLPCISIMLQDSTEAENTLGDIHYVPSEQVATNTWPILAGPFNPITYSAATGIMQVPDSIGNGIIIAPGMVLVDKIGKSYPILEVFSRSSFTIASGTIADFGSALLKGAKPAFIAQLESLSMKETYVLGCHVQGEPVFLTYLHSILVFILLRYKQALLEARGFERSVINSTDLRKNSSFDPEVVFSRFISITGYVRQYWPKTIDQRITSTSTTTTVDGAEVQENEDDLDWIGNRDSLGSKVR